MGVVDQNTEQKLREGFKYFNRFMLSLWRLGLGPWVNAWPEVGGRTMVITHTERRTGIRCRTSVNYAIVDGEIYCTAAFGGVADWCHDIKANPEVEVWLPDGWWAGVADEVTDANLRISLLRQVLIASGFVAHAAGIDANTMTNDELDAATRSYHLIHIRRTRACTGPGGPGDLAWVWPLTTFVLLCMLIGRMRRR
jgi:deazaflavin-dependent oxidoreductase (nitroreductase family)